MAELILLGVCHRLATLSLVEACKESQLLYLLHHFCNVNHKTVYLVGQTMYPCCLVDTDDRTTGSPARKLMSFE